MDATTIIRAPHNKKNPYVIMDKRIFENDALSWKAKGLLGYLLSRPDDWTVILTDLEKRSADGKHAVRTAIKELQEAGYMLHERRHNPETGQFEWTYIVHEAPYTDFPSMVNPLMENQTLLNNDLTNKESTNTLEDSKPESSTQPQLDIQLGDLETVEPTTAEDEMLFNEINEERKAKKRRKLTKFETVAQKRQWRETVAKCKSKYNGEHEAHLAGFMTAAFRKGITSRSGVIAYVAACFKGYNQSDGPIKAYAAR